MLETVLINAAESLLSEHGRGAHFKPFAAAVGITNVRDAYTVQREYVRLQMQARAVAAAGYKIGLTSKRMQDMCAIDSPIAGVVLSDRIHPSGVTLRPSAYGRLGVEFEIAVRLKRDLRADKGAPTLGDVADAVDAVAPAFELIDDRHADYRALDALSLIADNAWNAGVVLGEFVPAPPDLASVEGAVSIDGQMVDHGFGRDVLGHPFHPVAWLAGHLGETGSALKAGDIVMTGSIVTTKFPDGPAAYRFDISGLGVVELAIAP